jgi:alkanesulfonate monooxygenase SsuD/methylene tetrahydromethanopterin reductase-like flavin-dependent oxidoreductase (luciferase family)
MKIDAVFPQTEIGTDASVIRRYARAAEDAGYGTIIAYDHVLGVAPDHYPGFDGPYDRDDPFHEPFVLFAHLGAVTEEIWLATGVLVLPQRQTALVAKQAAASTSSRRGD